MDAALLWNIAVAVAACVLILLVAGYALLWRTK